MNKDALRKCEGMYVRIRPEAKRIDGGKDGPELPGMDDDWRVSYRPDEGLWIENLRTHHGTLLGFDHIHHFTTDPESGEGHGFLTLTVQIHLGTRPPFLWIEPNIRP